MTKLILFYCPDCPDTAPFVAELQRLGVQYEEVEILSSLANFKQFLRLRDSKAAFDNAKVNGSAGIPALLLEDGRVILDHAELAKIFAK